jgi:hypothetical protein
MNTLSPKLKKIEADKDKFDAILRRMADTKPLPVKDLTGTFPKLSSRKRNKQD